SCRDLKSTLPARRHPSNPGEPGEHDAPGLLTGHVVDKPSTRPTRIRRSSDGKHPSAASATSGSGSTVLPPDSQNHAKTRLAAHHALVDLGSALVREGLVHRLHVGARAEGEPVVRDDVNRGFGLSVRARPSPLLTLRASE